MGDLNPGLFRIPLIIKIVVLAFVLFSFYQKSDLNIIVGFLEAVYFRSGLWWIHKNAGHPFQGTTHMHIHPYGQFRDAD